MENLNHETPNHETYLADFAAREKIILDARRARAEAMLRFVVAPLARMIARLTARAAYPHRANGAVSGDTKVKGLDATRA
jgi:hypothetical protein